MASMGTYHKSRIFLNLSPLKALSSLCGKNVSNKTISDGASPNLHAIMRYKEEITSPTIIVAGRVESVAIVEMPVAVPPIINAARAPGIMAITYGPIWTFNNLDAYHGTKSTWRKVRMIIPATAMP